MSGTTPASLSGSSDICKNEYINSFSDNIYNVIQIDEKLAKQSLLNILSRDLNDSYNTLSVQTTKKLNILKNNVTE